MTSRSFDGGINGCHDCCLLPRRLGGSRGFFDVKTRDILDLNFGAVCSCLLSLRRTA